MDLARAGIPDGGARVRRTIAALQLSVTSFELFGRSRHFASLKSPNGHRTLPLPPIHRPDIDVDEALRVVGFSCLRL